MTSRGLRSWGVWVAEVLGLAAVNYIAGRVGLLLAIPPGYATAIWPPSGIALAALLLMGHRVWPGIWLGSFLINIGTSIDAATGASTLRSIWIASSIGLGSSVQAIVGALLIRRIVGFSTPLDTGRQVVTFLFLGGRSVASSPRPWG